jgi:hypothetical protein
MLFQFKIQLKNITNPTVWRRVVVPARFSFAKFHKVIQAAFGWENYHLYQFSPRGWGSQPVIGVPDPSGFESPFDEMEKLNSAKTKLSGIFTHEKQKYAYIYDFGDDWLHEITLEKISNDEAKAASCIGGKGACPPEDCGSWPGYERLKEIMADPTDPEHAEMREWLGLEDNETWNASAFDLEGTNKAVRQVR